MKIIVPIRIESTPNLREHWTSRSKRTRDHRAATHYSLMAAKAPIAVPCVVTLTRIAPRALDTDNNVSGFKWVRDAVAHWLRVDDADPRVEWRYSQAKGGPKEYAAVVEIT